ncbi:HPP family protein [Sporomusa sp.]|uniref:HPP family protein n=1 Tax=Sporomusa sp. TaxID=2078658 RepID=UPI002CB0F846|nr:HPP family protein [Sporomusa sp.]HWR41682.1 HPP family protein [Sporomusa sp.]
MSTARSILYRKLHLNHVLLSSLGSFSAVGIIAYISVTTGHAFLIPPFGATCYIAFVLPDSAFAQPRNIIGGHILACLIGLACLLMFGSNWWSQAIAMSAVVAIMQVTRTVHPPAAATTILITLQGGVDETGIFTTVLVGSMLIIGIAILFNKYIVKHNYPHYWW